MSDKNKTYCLINYGCQMNESIRSIMQDSCRSLVMRLILIFIPQI